MEKWYILTGYTDGQYWEAKDCFRICARNNEEYNDKYERMKAIAEYKEYKKKEHIDKWLCGCGGFIPKRNPETCISCGKEREQ